MISKIFFSTASLGLLALLLLSCAGQMGPEGGPVDSIPPTIIHTEPDTNQVHVNTDQIVLEFSEYVDRRSAEESIFISPPLGELEFDWSGPELTILFADSLRANKTYVVNVGTDVTDLRARNRMAHGFSLAFATGDSIDQGMLKGKVFDAKPEGVLIFGYSLNGISSDTLDPGKLKPDYITQTGKDGNWTLSNLAWGRYRLFAVRDEYRNLLYDKQIDQFGVTTGDFRIDSVRVGVNDIWFRLSQEDTAKPFVTRVQPLDQKRIQVSFSEPVDTVSFRRADISIQDTATGASIDIVLRSLDKPDSSVATLLTVSRLDSAAGYRLIIRGLTDTVGNAIDTSHAGVTFGGTNMIDTLKPSFAVPGIRDSIRNVALDQRFILQFSEPVQPLPMNSAVEIRDSNRTLIASALSWQSAANLRVTTREPLVPNMRFEMRIVLDSLSDFSGNGYNDSVTVLRFWSLDLRTTGTIDGFVMDPDTTDDRGEIVLTATQLYASPPKTQSQRLKGPGDFHFEHLPEGRYLLDSFRDRDSSRTYSFGKPYPFVTSERFVFFPDTLKVRARWGVEGVNVIYK
ncbi:MAG: Ig-like domain-containing protein [Ignavibacteriae bacterium]|nr:Ig-like domain-containing protein [Ignavibacteriota bacterium]